MSADEAPGAGEVGAEVVEGKDLLEARGEDDEFAFEDAFVGKAAKGGGGEAQCFMNRTGGG